MHALTPSPAPQQMQTMLNSPEFLQQMSSVMSNPAVLDQIIASNPQLAAMGPQVREVFRSERFRQMMANPDTLRMMLQMSNLMRDSRLAPRASRLPTLWAAWGAWARVRSGGVWRSGRGRGVPCSWDAFDGPAARPDGYGSGCRDDAIGGLAVSSEPVHEPVLSPSCELH